MRLWFAGGLAGLAIGLCLSPLPAAAASRPTQAPCRIDIPAMDDVPAGQEDALCGTFTVPENRAHPERRSLPLRFVILPTRNPQPREPVFVLAGGPGQAATSLAPDYARAGYREDRDIVLLDMRGTGEGNRLDCDFGGSDTDPQGYLEPLFIEGEGYAACRDRLAAQADLTQYTLPIALQDLDAFRQALGRDRIVLDGGSFGTRAGLVYIRRYPSHVHAAVLSGLVPLENRAPLFHARAAQRSFDLMVRQCDAEAACRVAYPDIPGDLALVQSRLREAPAEVRVKHPVTGAPTTLRLSGPAFADGLRVMLYSDDAIHRVPLLLSQAKAGDLSPFAEAAMRSSRGLKTSLRLGLLLSATCSEDVWRIDPSEIARETAGSFIGDSRVRGQVAACSVWPKGRMPDGYYDPATADTPVLLISGDLDPVTPPSWAEQAARSLPNSVQVLVPGGHVPWNACINTLSRQFARDGVLADRSCVAEQSHPPFVLPGGPTSRGGNP